MPAPSLRIPLSLTMDDFNKNISAAKEATSTATRFIVKQFIDMNASVLATGGAAGSAVLAFHSLLGIIGQLSAAIVGGMTSEKAMTAVKHHVDMNEHGLLPSVLVAYAVLEAVMIGVPDEPVGKETPAEAKHAGSTTTTDASDAPKSSPSAPALDGRPASPMSRRSGKSSPR
jgi:hypothetical protein